MRRLEPRPEHGRVLRGGTGRSRFPGAAVRAVPDFHEVIALGHGIKYKHEL